MFHTIGYSGANAATAVPGIDLTALTDTIISQRNGHLIFTDQFNLIYSGAFAAHISDARIFTPGIAAINPDGFRLDGLNVTAGLPGAPTLVDQLRNYPLAMPMEEELQITTTSPTNSERQWWVGTIATPGWNTNLPGGMLTCIEGTATAFTPTANVWSGSQIWLPTSTVRSGIYYVIGASLQQAADTLAFRLIFPRMPLISGRAPRPGWFAQNAVGAFEDVVTQVNRFHLGVWSAFHPFELPTFEVLASTSASMTPILRLWCLYNPGTEANLPAALASIAH